jgi:hypothetical protein
MIWDLSKGEDEEKLIKENIKEKSFSAKAE